MPSKSIIKGSTSPSNRTERGRATTLELEDHEALLKLMWPRPGQVPSMTKKQSYSDITYMYGQPAY